MSNRLWFKSVTLLIVWIILTYNVNSSQVNEPVRSDLPWYKEILKEIQRTLIDCRKKTDAFNTNDEDYQVSLIRMKNCVKEVILTSLDGAFSEHKLSINEYLSLVKERNFTEK